MGCTLHVVLLAIDDIEPIRKCNGNAGLSMVVWGMCIIFMSVNWLYCARHCVTHSESI